MLLHGLLLVQPREPSIIAFIQSPGPHRWEPRLKEEHDDTISQGNGCGHQPSLTKNKERPQNAPLQVDDTTVSIDTQDRKASGDCAAGGAQPKKSSYSFNT